MAQTAPASTIFPSILEPIYSKGYIEDGSASGIPRNLVSPLAWGPGDLPAANSETTRLQLNSAELSEIQTALDAFKGVPPQIVSFGTEECLLTPTGIRVRT